MIEPVNFSPQVAQSLLDIEQFTFMGIVLALVALMWTDLSDSFSGLSAPGKMFGTVAFLFMLGWMIPGLGIEGIPLAVALTSGVALSTLSPGFGLCFFIATLLLRPWEIQTTNSVFLALPRMTAIAMMVGWMRHAARARAIRFRFGTEEILLAAFGVWTYVTAFMAPNWVESSQVFVQQFSRALIVFFLVLQLLRTPRDLRALGAVIGISGMALATLSAYRLGWDPATAHRLRAELFGLLGDPNDLSAILLLSLPFVLREVSLLPLGKLTRWTIAIFMMTLSVGVIMATQSRGALVGLLAALLAAGVLRVRNQRQVIALLGVLAVAGVVLFTTLRRSDEDLVASKASRIAYWSAGVDMAIRSPIWGVGFGGYPYRFAEFVDASVAEAGLRTAHSIWVLALAETGFVGFGLLLALFAIATRYAWQMRKEEPHLMPALVGYGAAASFLSHTYLVQPYLLLAFIFAAAGLREESDAPRHSQNQT